MDKKEILSLVKKYYRENLNPKNKSKSFKKGQRIPYAGRVYDEKELINLVDASLDFWLTTGRFADEFEENFASFQLFKKELGSSLFARSSCKS